MKIIMPEMPSGFWSGWIIVLTLVSLLGLLWLVAGAYFAKDRQHEEGDEPVWDNDLREGQDAPPIWWFSFLLGSLIFSLIYLMLYPGLGSYEGFLHWSQDSRLNEAYVAYDAQIQQSRQTIVEADLSSLQADPEMMQIAARIFRRECGVCHGAEGGGQAALFPDLHDSEWQWGGEAEQIEQSIRAGRNANMISWQAMLGDEAIAQIANYVTVIGDVGSDTHDGKALFEQSCAACHGVNGVGNPLLGAPDLTNDIWLYGGSVATITETIALGRTGIMPAFSSRLDDTQIRLLVAWLIQ